LSSADRIFNMRINWLTLMDPNRVAVATMSQAAVAIQAATKGSGKGNIEFHWGYKVGKYYNFFYF